MIFTNFRLCTRRGKRVAVFAEPTDKGTRIFILTCSKKDSFSRRIARETYNNYIRSGGDQCYYTLIKGKYEDNKHIVNVERHDCHPEVIQLDEIIDNVRISAYLSACLVTYIPWSQIKEGMEESGYYIDFPGRHASKTN